MLASSSQVFITHKPSLNETAQDPIGVKSESARTQPNAFLEKCGFLVGLKGLSVIHTGHGSISTALKAGHDRRVIGGDCGAAGANCDADGAGSGIGAAPWVEQHEQQQAIVE